MKKKLFFAVIASWFFGMLGWSQELNCTVSVNSDKIEGSNKSVFTDLQNNVSNFLNQTRWTNMTMLSNEKIECSMLIVVKSYSDGVMVCEMTLQSKRPVYNSSYTTTLLNYRDEKFNFQYNEFDKIEFRLNSPPYKNLAALLTYYAYLIIGYDADSFEKLGGTPYYQICENIVTTMQTSSLDKTELAGWHTMNTSRNRYTIINNLLDDAFKNFRLFQYTYHRLGLDEMVNSTANARGRINQDLGVLKEAYRVRTTSYIVSMFLDAKSDELANIYSKASEQERKNAYNILTNIDPTREETYKKMNN